MKITWVTRSFLDYRIPVYKELNKLCGNNLSVVYYSDVVPPKCWLKLSNVLADRNIGLTGELRLSGRKMQPATLTVEKGVRIPVQPGLISTIMKTDPDVIISDGFFQWTYAALWLRAFYRIPHLMCYEATMHTERNSGWLRKLYRRMASRFIDHITCNGSLSRDYIISLGYPPEKISLGNMTSDIKELHKKASAMTESEKKDLKKSLGIRGKVMIFIGRTVPLKGIDKLIESWKIAFMGNPDLTLLIVGDGEQKNKLEEICKTEGIENIIFAGNVDYDLIYKYLGISDIFIMPSLRDNWSLVVPEAMSCSLPVICSKYNGCWPELVRPENGWIFDPLNTENFTATLICAWENKEKWKEMGKESYRIVNDFSPEKIAAGIFDGCKSILN